MKLNTAFSVEQTMRLLSIPSPTGYTAQVTAYLMDTLKEMGFQPVQNRKGSVCCTLGGEGRPLALAAHVDTLGLMVRSIKSNGALMFTRVGGPSYQAVETENVTLITRDGRSYSGVVQLHNASVHVNREVDEEKRNDSTLEVLLDAGAETEMGYAGDMSSTMPADKKFTTRQKEIYDIQVASHEAAVAALRPGVPFVDVYELSCKVIMEGLKELGFVKGDPMEAVKAGAHAMFMPCGLGHMMGLDVHDMENLGEVYVGYNGQPKSTQFGRKSLRLGRKLEPGFVLTIEPGVYFIPELMDLWYKEQKFTEFINYDKLFTYKDFSGIRNEEDYLITADGARRLGKRIPLHTDEVEALHC